MDFAAELRNAGLRATQPRLAALAFIAEKGHCTVDDVRDHVRAKIGSVSVQAVYDIVHILTEKRILREVRPVGLPTMYEIETCDNHHHIVCRICRKIENVPCAVGYRPCLQASTTYGYVIDEAEVVYWGVCPGCGG